MLQDARQRRSLYIESRKLSALRIRMTKTIQIKVKPNAHVSLLEETANGTWLAQLKSLPIDGKANEELVTLVAKQFGCRKADVKIKTGAGGRMKLVQIASGSDVNFR
jgi:uncharacterized protein